MWKDRIWYYLHAILSPNSLKTMEWRMLMLLNQDRRYHQLGSLTMQEDLRTVARNHSFHMAEKDFFAHVDPNHRDPGDRIRGAGITDTTFGENLAKMRGFKNVTEEAEIALMKSPGHRANILYKDFNCVGVGVIQAKDETYYFTQNFARRFLRMTSHKLYIKYQKPITIKAKIIDAFANITIEERYKKPFTCTPKIQGDQVVFVIKLEERGRYELEFLVQPIGHEQWCVSNVVHLRAYSSIFDRFLV